MRTLTACALALIATAALAEEKCLIEVGPNDVVQKHGTLVVEPGRKVEDAFALDGDVVVKAGAEVNTALAMNGDVVVEDGAVVKDSAVSVGGKVKAGAGARVKDSVEIADNGVHVKGKKGGDVAVNINVDGESLGKRIVDEALKKVQHCRIVEKR